MDVEVELLGIYRRFAKTGRVVIPLKRAKKLRYFIQDICSVLGPKFKAVFLDLESNSPLPNSLILVNGREVSTLKGLDTEIRKGDVITLLPITHGG